MMRTLLCCGHHATGSVDRDMRVSGRAEMAKGTPPFGWTMPRAGSVVGITACVISGSHAADGTLTVEVGGASGLFTATSPTIDAASTVYSWSEIQDAGVDTFSAGDVLKVQVIYDSGTFQFGHCIITVEVEFDES